MEPFLVRRSRGKLLVLGTLALALAILGLIVAIGARSPWVLLGFFGFGFTGVFALREAGKREPALVIDDAGIEDTRVGLRLAWSEIERIRLRRRWAASTPQTWLLLEVRDLTAVAERIPRAVGRRLGRVDAKLGVQNVFFVLNLLAVRPRRILEEIRRRYPGTVAS